MRKRYESRIINSEDIVTTEDDFQNKLDADPTDWQTRLVFADWLEDRNDPRAAGYRALAVLRVRPNNDGTRCGWTRQSNSHITGVTKGGKPITGRSYRWTEYVLCALPDDWFNALFEGPTNFAWSEKYHSRRAAEDDACVCFLSLSDDRRAELREGVSV